MSVFTRLPKRNADGAIYINSALATAIDRVENGLPYEADGALSLDPASAIHHYHNGLPFTAESRIAANVGGGVNSIAPGPLPLDAAGRVVFYSFPPADHHASGVAFGINDGILFSSTPP